MHAAALIDLLYEGGVGKSLQRAISSLQTAARLSDRPAPVLADLAAAYLVRAERAGTPRDLLAAIEAAEEALQHELRNRAALYNLALALQRLGLVEETAEAWRGYLAADAASAWRREAERHRREVLAIENPPPPPAPDAADSAYTAYAAADPQAGRVIGWCRVLGAWANAALSGETAEAEAHLRRAEALAGMLERRPGGDATLADAVRAVRTRSGTPAIRRLARGHAEFAAGCAADERVDFPGAASRYAAAADAADGSVALRGWGRLMYGGMVFRAGQVRTGEAVLREVRSAADTVRHPALAAEARRTLAALLLRGDRYEAALSQAREAAALFKRAGERENHGVALDAVSIAEFHLREMDHGYATAHAALERLRPYRGSFRLHNLLALTGQTVADDGFRRAALHMLNEGVRVAERTRRPVFVAEAYLIRARLLAEGGAYSAATRDVAAGQAAVAQLTVQGSREWMAAEFRIASAAIALREAPVRAARDLDSAAAFFMGLGAPMVALPAVVGAAQAHLAAGDAAEGTVRLEVALGILEQRRDSIRMEPRRAAVFHAARAVLDGVTMLKLASGGAAEGLAYLDRGRASLAAAGGAVPRGSTVIEAPPGEVALVYALVADTLLTWTVAGRRVELARAVVDTLRLARSIEHLRWQLEAGGDEAELRSALAELYERLIRPVEGRLGAPDGALVVVVDGDLAAVPFPALFDSKRRRYLVEDRRLRFAPSLAEARRPAPRGGAHDPLFVADPAFDPARHPGFTRLTGAVDEVRQVSTDYLGAQVLGGREASPQALRTLLTGVGLLHYAGHAVFDDERPERSYLLLASAPAASGTGTLEAGEIAQMELRHLSLVVLAACQTVRTGRGRAAGFSGLAGAFLAAGAGGAIGSLWEVEDHFTRPLMVEFHRAYRALGNAPQALRVAQLRLLHSSDPALRSPSAWAGFRYAGR
jgi:CHAT domain-containing protein